MQPALHSLPKGSHLSFSSRKKFLTVAPICPQHEIDKCRSSQSCIHYQSWVFTAHWPAERASSTIPLGFHPLSPLLVLIVLGQVPWDSDTKTCMQEVFWGVSLNQLLWGLINARLGRGKGWTAMQLQQRLSPPCGMAFQRCISQSLCVAALRGGHNIGWVTPLAQGISWVGDSVLTHQQQHSWH